jgi:periplasmic divalent cation tolerance protein
MILILVSFESNEDAEKAANYLIEQNLAACVEVYPVRNFYYWKGEKVAANEFSGVIKTEDGYFDKVGTALEKILPYDIPQIIELKASKVNEPYIKWLKKSLD